MNKPIKRLSNTPKCGLSFVRTPSLMLPHEHALEFLLLHMFLHTALAFLVPIMITSLCCPFAIFTWSLPKLYLEKKTLPDVFCAIPSCNREDTLVWYRNLSSGGSIFFSQHMPQQRSSVTNHKHSGHEFQDLRIMQLEVQCRRWSPSWESTDLNVTANRSPSATMTTMIVASIVPAPSATLQPDIRRLEKVLLDPCFTILL